MDLRVFLVGLLIFLGGIAFFVLPEMVDVSFLALASGGVQGVVYLSGETAVLPGDRVSVVDPVRWASIESDTGLVLPPLLEDLVGSCKVGSGPFAGNVFGRGIKLEECPQGGSAFDRGVGRNAFKSFHPAAGEGFDDGSLRRFQLHLLKDFYGQDVRIVAGGSSVGDVLQVVIGDFGSGNWRMYELVKGGQGQFVETELVEVVPNELDPLEHEVFIGGRSVDVLRLVSGEELRVGFQSLVGSWVVLNVNFEPQFGCEVLPGELLVRKSFTGAHDLDIFSFDFPVVRFCEEFPVSIGSQAGQGFETSLRPYRTLKGGGSVSVPAGQVWEFTYVMRNEDRDGNPFFSVQCDTVVDVDSGACVPAIGILELCSEGFFDAVTRSCVKTVVETPCLGVFDIQKNECVTVVPVDQVCAEGTLNVVTAECQPLRSNCPLGTEKRFLGGSRFECVQSVSDSVVSVLEPVNGVIGVLEDRVPGISERGVLLMVLSLVGLLVLFFVGWFFYE